MGAWWELGFPVEEIQQSHAGPSDQRRARHRLLEHESGLYAANKAVKLAAMPAEYGAAAGGYCNKRRVNPPRASFREGYDHDNSVRFQA
jgi:hypothetical protein